MSLFLITFFFIYGSVHLYILLRARYAFSMGSAALAAASLLMLFMVAAPVFVRIAERAGHGTLARIIGYVGYTWMGLLFLMFSASLVVDLYRIVHLLAGKAAGRTLSAGAISPRAAFYLPLILSLAIAFYGYFEGKNIRVERLTVRSSKIPPEIGTVRVAQISDLHLGLIEREKRLKEVMKIVKRIEPDLFVATGDLVDGQMYDLGELVDLFNDFEPRFGKYAVTGNHEFYAGLSQALDFTRKAGFTVLRGEAHTNPGVIHIVGVDDPAGNYYKDNIGPTEREILTGLPEGRFTILLKHRPVLDPESAGLFDLQLSGHTHRGQIFPFRYLSRLYYPKDSGLYNSEEGSLLYVSRGTGTWGPPIRFLAPPEITVIDLVHSEGAERRVDVPPQEAR